MTADPSRESFVSTLRRSRLLEPAEVDRHLSRHPGAAAAPFADALVRSGTLTHYQADKLLRGLWQGLVLGPYSILAPIGRGGMGTVVYLARDRRASEALGDTELVALKLLPERRTAHDPRILTRFRREMELGRRVDHPNVVQTLASGAIDGVHYLALGFVPGRTLRQTVQAGGPLSVGEAARVFADVAAGLAHVHARRLVHRDVKPANVMIRPDGRAVVLDLGLAYAPGEPLPADPTIVGGRGYVVGTMDYLAPEQARDAARVGPAADLYSLGCALVFALTGAAPFPAATTMEKVRRHRTDPPPALDGVPSPFVRIVNQLLAKRPDQRPGSAAEVRDLLTMWATAAPARAAASALAEADHPGTDAGLWDASPGEALPLAEPFEVLEEIPDEPEVLELPDDDPPRRTGCASAALVLAAVAARWLV